MEKLKVGITGSAGFIGKHLIRELSKDDAVHYAVFEGNLLKKPDLDSFFNANPNLNCIVHLAGVFSDNLDELLQINVKATFNLLEGMTKNKVNRIVFSSTGAVYGEPLHKESIETDPLNPNTLYGLSKMHAEDVISYYANNFGIEHVILRFPNVYGKGNDKGVIYNFIKGIREGKGITIYGDGEQSRNFLHVSDAVSAIILSAKSEAIGVFNISNPVKVTLNDLASILSDRYGEFAINFRPLKNNLKDLLLNCSLAESRLKFSPKITKIKIDL